MKVDHSTIKRGVLADAPAIERPLRRFRKPLCGAMRVLKPASGSAVSGAACTAPSTSTARLSTSYSQPIAIAMPSSDSSARCCRIRRCSPLIASVLRRLARPGRRAGRKACYPARPRHTSPSSGSKASRASIPGSRGQFRVGGLRSFVTARPAIRGIEAMLWPRKGFGFAQAWSVREQSLVSGLLLWTTRLEQRMKADLYVPAWSQPRVSDWSPRPPSILPDCG